MGLELVKITGEMQLEHQKPVGPSNQENRTTFWAVPLFLGIFQLGQSFSPDPEFLEFLTKWKVPQVNGDSTRTKKLKLHYKVSAKYGALQTSTVCKPHSTIHSAGIFFFTSSWPSLIFFFFPSPTPQSCFKWSVPKLFSVFMWRLHIRKWKIIFPSEVSVPSDKKPHRTLTFHNVSAR